MTEPQVSRERFEEICERADGWNLDTYEVSDLIAYAEAQHAAREAAEATIERVREYGEECDDQTLLEIIGYWDASSEQSPAEQETGE